MIKLKEIGAVVEKKGYDTPSGKYRFFGTNAHLFHEEGFNNAVDESCEIAIEFSRERLAKVLLKAFNGFDYDTTEEIYKKIALGFADAVIAEEKSILEVVK